MRQTTLCVPLEVKPESCDRLVALIDTLKRAEDFAGDPTRPNFAHIFAGIPTLHFLSISVFPGHDYDPMFIIEANFDGPAGVFWGQLESLLSDRLRPMIRCCKRPFDGTGDLYDAVTAADARSPAVAFLEAQVRTPSVFHHGNRGLTRDRILGDHALFLAARAELDGPVPAGPNPYRGSTAADIHRTLRAAMLPRFPWLAEPAPVRIPPAERAADMARLIGFVVVTLLALSLPGLLLAPLMSAPLYLILTALCSAAALALVWRYRHAISGTEVAARVHLTWPQPDKLVLLAVGVVVYAVAATFLLGIVVAVVHFVSLAADGLAIGRTIAWDHAWWVTFRAVVLGLVSLAATIPVLVLVLRWNELRDSHQDAPPIDDAVLREMVRREDWITQNHMGSIVLIKPGILRSIIIRAGHRGLGLLLRVVATDGFLGSMRTVHFAHWAFLNNNSRLLFFSNFDHSWDSYLDDFIEKSHVG
ncbi:MAG: hypothetical protein JO290_02685, partial [Sphingomonadaceae bacterium]|nr:hypothetical protein [Sphingomonadaceae bacterium]